MIDPVTGVKLVQQAYGVQAGLMPVLPVGYEVQDILFGKDLNGTMPFGFLALCPDGSQVIACRGTDDAQEWIEDAAVVMVSNPWGPGRVHLGFSLLTGSFGFGDNLVPISQKIASNAKLALLGHSLGAACMRLLSMKLGHVSQVQTWGEPKGGDQTAAQYEVSCATSHHRGVNTKDLVPMVPEYLPPLFEYFHAVPETTLGSVGSNPANAHSLSTYLSLESGITPT